jgi:hypothetical protein
MGEQHEDTLHIESERDGSKYKVTARRGTEVVHKDIIDPASATQRQRFIKGVRARLPALKEMQADDLNAELLKLADTTLAPADDNGHGHGDAVEDAPAVVAEARHLLNQPCLLTMILDDIAALGVAGERELTATVYLAGVSRLLEKPLAVIVQGPSSSGKSYIIEKAALLFPHQAVILAHQMTPQALFHMPPGSLAHRFVVAGERCRAENDDTAEATRALREMLSSGKLSKMMPVKTGNAIETILIEQEGPIAYVESTTLNNVFEEDANRCLMVQTDERAEQTQRIIKAAASVYGGNGMSQAGRAAILRRHHCLQRHLEPIPVVVPYAELVAERFGVRRVEARRAFPQAMTLVQAVALLYQHQRKRDGNGHLLATPEDYQVARHLLLKPLSRQVGTVSDGARRFYDVLRKKVAAGPEFTSKQAKQWEASSPSSVYGWLTKLHDAGALELVQESKGQRPAVWKMTDSDIQGGMTDPALLPTAEDLFPGVLVGSVGATSK